MLQREMGFSTDRWRREAAAAAHQPDAVHLVRPADPEHLHKLVAVALGLQAEAAARQRHAAVLGAHGGVERAEEHAQVRRAPQVHHGMKRLQVGTRGKFTSEMFSKDKKGGGGAGLLFYQAPRPPRWTHAEICLCWCRQGLCAAAGPTLRPTDTLSHHADPLTPICPPPPPAEVNSLNPQSQTNCSISLPLSRHRNPTQVNHTPKHPPPKLKDAGMTEMRGRGK